MLYPFRPPTWSFAAVTAISGQPSVAQDLHFVVVVNYPQAHV